MVYIASINKNVFPHYTPPISGELFSSWICRMASSHHIKPQSFVRNYLDNYPIFARDIDLYYSSKLISFFTTHTPMTTTEVEDMFLTSYNSIICEGTALQSGYNNILSLGIHHRKRKRFGLMYCSGCLKQSSVYLKKWRLQTSLACVACNQLLFDRCPSCSATITFHRINALDGDVVSVMDLLPLTICSECGFDLSSINNIPPSALILEYQKYIDETILRGYNDITGYSFSYIKTLLVLSRRLNARRRNNRLKEGIVYYYPELANLEGTHLDTQDWDLETRLLIFPIIAEVLGTPGLLESIFTCGRMSKSYIDFEGNLLPFWITRMLCF